MAQSSVLPISALTESLGSLWWQMEDQFWTYRSMVKMEKLKKKMYLSPAVAAPAGILEAMLPESLLQSVGRQAAKVLLTPGGL